MTMNRDVFLSILVMDSCNRGYGQGVTGLLAANRTRPVNASILTIEGSKA